MADVESLNHSGLHMHELLEMEEFYGGVLGGTYNHLDSLATPGESPATCIMLGDFQLLFRFPERRQPMPAETEHRGMHGFRHGFSVSRARFDEVLNKLQSRGIAFEGPMKHPQGGPFGESIYLKDPAGNFLEICWRRDEDRKYNPVFVGEGD